MKIEEVSGGNLWTEQVGTAQAIDSESKNLQNQIVGEQKRLKELTVNNELNAEEKTKKRKEIQKQITELNNKLRQHQVQQRREQQEKEKNRKDMSLGEKDESQEEERSSEKGMWQTGMKAIVSADSAISQAKAQENVSMIIDSKVRVLQGEIKQDTGRGKDTKMKQKELENLEDKAIRVKAAKMEILADAALEIKQASEKENQMDKKTGEEKKSSSEDGVPIFKNSAAKKKTDIYGKGKMFSNVDFHI